MDTQYKEALPEQYQALIIPSPSDPVEVFINDALQGIAQELTTLDNDNPRKAHLTLKLDSILSMTKEQFFALAISDMQKRQLAIPEKYHHLKTQDESNHNRDIIISPRVLRNKLICYLIPYTIVVFVLGLFSAYVLFPSWY